MNIIIMKTGKSELLDHLSKTNTVVVGVGTQVPKELLVKNQSFANVEHFSDVMDIARELRVFDRIIFYSYKRFSHHIETIKIIEDRLDDRDCFFMFGSYW